MTRLHWVQPIPPWITKSHLINLWFPSICQVEFGPSEWYTLLLIATLLLKIVFNGSTRWIEPLKQPRWTLTPCRARWPIMPVWILQFDRMRLSSLASLMSAKVWNVPSLLTRRTRVDLLMSKILAIRSQLNRSDLRNWTFSKSILILGLPALFKKLNIIQYTNMTLKMVPWHNSRPPVKIISKLGRMTNLIKINLKDAYRIVPVHPDGHWLLGVRWDGDIYVDWGLPFGLRSALKIFSALADALAWSLYVQGIQHQLHYLDNFLFFGPPNTPCPGEILQAAVTHLAWLSVPIATHKTEGPATCVLFLGILIDTDRRELRLQLDKVQRLQALIREWCGRTSATARTWRVSWITYPMLPRSFVWTGPS